MSLVPMPTSRSSGSFSVLMPRSSIAEMEVMLHAPTSSNPSKEWPLTIVPVPVCIEANQGKVASEAETSCATRVGSNRASRQAWRVLRKHALSVQQLQRQSCRSADPFTKISLQSSRYPPLTVSFEVCITRTAITAEFSSRITHKTTRSDKGLLGLGLGLGLTLTLTITLAILRLVRMVFSDMCYCASMSVPAGDKSLKQLKISFQ